MKEITVGVGGSAGDGMDKMGDTLAKTCERLGLHVFAYNSYQSIIRGGHIWLRVRIGEEKNLMLTQPVYVDGTSAECFGGNGCSVRVLVNGS